MSQYPRIWDRSGERTIIGQTKVSWIVGRRGGESAYWVGKIETLAKNRKSDSGGWTFDGLRRCGHVDLVPKSEPNRGFSPHHPYWFTSEAEWLDMMFAYKHGSAISEQVGRADGATLRKIADLIGYKDSK